MSIKKVITLSALVLTSIIVFAYTSKNTKVLRHVVLFKFKAEATAAQIKIVEDAFKVLPSKIKEVKSFEWGINNSTEGLNDGLTHCFFVTFKNEKDRATYLPHPDHKAFVALLLPFLEKAVVVDYWAEK